MDNLDLGAEQKSFPIPISEYGAWQHMRAYTRKICILAWLMQSIIALTRRSSPTASYASLQLSPNPILQLSLHSKVSPRDRKPPPEYDERATSA